MYSKWGLIWPFFLILTLHLIAILFFTRGFLLSRTELSTYSNCSDVSKSPCFPPPTANLNSTSQTGCWTKPAVDRIVIIILDALRFDFVAPSSLFPEKKPWMDKLQVLQMLASDEGSSATIFKAIADPPTTTLQRLKGLTTGGLPTFIDVGNSFGAPAIIEDNLLYQLVKNGKRVRLMGDDTWMQLFPDHFEKSYPFPSFNVKDLDTVDDGCIQHLFPSLYEEDWDVLIAHFLGVDHAGHIFGVESNPMMMKLEQYNAIMEKVIEVLKNQSGPGELHENTLLLVMGDHGQTLNGDHGGGTAEEVETSLFAMNLRSPPASLSSKIGSSWNLNLDGRKTRVSSIQQLDFAVTVAALLGVPFPFGSIGRVHPELYALSPGTWDQPKTGATSCKSQSNIEKWMQNYANVLCINSWQVKRYIDTYSASSVIGFPLEDLVHVDNMYAEAQDSWSQMIKNLSLPENEVQGRSCDTSLVTNVQEQIHAYSDFLESVAELARSKWTQFDLMMMGLGLGILLLSLFIHLLIIRRVNKLLQISHPSVGSSRVSVRFVSALCVVALRGCSFLANSYILAEGKVANFLLGTTAIISLRHSIITKKMSIEATGFLMLDLILRFTTEPGLSKTMTSALMNLFSLRVLDVNEDHPLWVLIPDTVSILSLIFLIFLLCKVTAGNCRWRFLKYSVVTATIISYCLVAIHWTLESNILKMPFVLDNVERSFIPHMVYTIGLGLVVLLTFAKLFEKENTPNYTENIFFKAVGMLSAWSATVILIMGRQGPLFVLAAVVGGWCIIQLELSKQKTSGGKFEPSTDDLFPVVQWSLLAVCLFFCTGHWCAFDGLRYGAAFIGFDEFNLIPQAILLSIDTFGVSHILPILGLPLLVTFQYPKTLIKRDKRIFFLNLSQVLLMYGLITAITTTFTVVCVTIQRRHLMVWGLFAPKFVFDVVGLVLTDVLICISSLYYFDQRDGDIHMINGPKKKK